MDLPPSHAPCWRRLAEGGLARIHTDSVAMQMMNKRLERSADSASQKASEIYSFFEKWQRSLQNEIAQLARV
jgi:hypothetical protein